MAFNIRDREAIKCPLKSHEAINSRYSVFLLYSTFLLQKGAVNTSREKS